MANLNKERLYLKHLQLTVAEKMQKFVTDGRTDGQGYTLSLRSGVKIN